MSFAAVVNAEIWKLGSIFSDVWYEEPVPVDPDVITDHVARALSLFITQFRQTRIVTNEQGFTGFITDNDSAAGGVVIDTEEPITDHVDRALSLFITQFRQTREL